MVNMLVDALMVGNKTLVMRPVTALGLSVNGNNKTRVKSPDPTRRLNVFGGAFRLPRIMAALAAAPIRVKHRREEEAEQERIRAEEHARWCREMARKERAQNRRSFIEEKATEFSRFQQIATLSDFISKEANSHSAEPVGRISRVIEKMVSEMRLGFEREALNKEISKLELFGDDDPV